MAKHSELDLPTLGEACLHYLAETPELLGTFLAETGLSPAGLRSALGGEALNRALVDYFAANESLLLALCASQNWAPESIMRVWARLNPAG